MLPSSKALLFLSLVALDGYLLISVLLISGFIVDDLQHKLSPLDFTVFSSHPRLLYFSESEINKAVFQPALRSLGFREEGPRHGKTHLVEWLWTHAFPFKITRNTRPVPGKLTESLQLNLPVKVEVQETSKINHIPGMGTIASKDKLTTVEYPKFVGRKTKDGNANEPDRLIIKPSDFIPMTFSIPRQLDEFYRKALQPDMPEYWIQKNKVHRGCQVVHISELELNHTHDVLIQQFIANQLLIHGHTFQIGVHVLFTSVSPMRAYILKTHIGHRMAPKMYNATDFSDSKTYVTDGHIALGHLFDLSDFKTHRERRYSGHDMFMAYVRSKGHDPEKIYHQIIDAVADVIYRKRFVIVGYSNRYSNSSTLFFEHMRWDFIVDQDMRVYLLEANMSPEMSGQFRIGAHIAYNVLNTVKHTWARNSSNLKGVRPTDVTTYNKACYSEVCQICARKMECILCAHCMSDDVKRMLQSSMVEHVLRGGWRRAYPAPDSSVKGDYPTNAEEDLKKDVINKQWFKTRCQQDGYWCT